MYDAIQRPSNADINFDDEAETLGISSHLLKYCLGLSKPPSTTARKLFQYVCIDELSENATWSNIPASKIDAIQGIL